MIRNAFSELLYTGDAISARNLKLIYEHEFTAVVDLAANESPAALGRDIIYCRFPLHDDSSNDDAMLAAAIDCLVSLLRHDYRTLVTCSAGMSRSPVISAAAISLVTGDSLADCLRRIIADAPHDVSPGFLSSVDHVHHSLAMRK